MPAAPLPVAPAPPSAPSAATRRRGAPSAPPLAGGLPPSPGRASPSPPARPPTGAPCPVVCATATTLRGRGACPATVGVAPCAGLAPVITRGVAGAVDPVAAVRLPPPLLFPLC
eukprot:751952-Pleurochrysis_carterae.AAC.1